MTTRLTPEDVHDHIHGVCFKTGPPGTVGAETEWFVAARDDPSAPVDGARVRALVDAAGAPPGGSRVTYEPGGQIELSSAPLPGLGAVHTALTRDIAHLRAALAGGGLTLRGGGADPFRVPRFQAEHPRYASMRTYFTRRGHARPGLAMMCSTASVQVCLDVGADAADARLRWDRAHALGPVLVAAFANSPVHAGRTTGWRSTRQRIWAELDPCRTRPVRSAGDPDGDPAAAWLRYALDARIMVRRSGDGWEPDPGVTFGEWLSTGEPELADLVYHLSTLFPPVRPRGWLELRMIDTPPPRYWAVPVAVATALLDDPVAADRAAVAVAPVVDRWLPAARDGLDDPPLARAARACFDAALEALPRLGARSLVPSVAEYAERYVHRARTPADDPREDAACHATL